MNTSNSGGYWIHSIWHLIIHHWKLVMTEQLSYIWNLFDLTALNQTLLYCSWSCTEKEERGRLKANANRSCTGLSWLRFTVSQCFEQGLYSEQRDCKGWDTWWFHCSLVIYSHFYSHKSGIHCILTTSIVITCRSKQKSGAMVCQFVLWRYKDIPVYCSCNKVTWY